ncbi:hypothetical protein CJU89_0912 [Yarrowia sp. B02]|nr:hypothetical protein CJU89_0912 [Yarrowia sp. B02]
MPAIKSPNYTVDDLIGPCRLTLGNIEFIHGGYVQVDKKDVFHEQIFHNTKTFIKKDGSVKVIEANEHAPGPAVSHHAVVLEDKIIVFGGYFRKSHWFENRDNSIFVFDNKTEQWVDAKMVHFHDKFSIPENIPNADLDTPRIYIGTRRQLNSMQRCEEHCEQNGHSLHEYGITANGSDDVVKVGVFSSRLSEFPKLLDNMNSVSKTIHIDQPAEWVEAFQQYTLTGVVPDNYDQLCGLLIMAKTYEIEDLKIKAEEKLMKIEPPCAASAVTGWYRAYCAGNRKVRCKIAKDCLKLGKECAGKEMEMLQNQGLLVDFNGDVFA